MRIGDRLRQLRQNKDMTLARLSRSSKIDMATLSRIENNRMTGSLKSHIKICKVLGVTLPQLYLPAEQLDLSLDKNLQLLSSSRGNDKVSFEILTTNASNRKMLPTLIKIQPGCASQKESGKPGAEKLIYVISAMAEVNVDGKSFRLLKGDNFYFNAASKHYFKNTAKKEARLLCVESPAA